MQSGKPGLFLATGGAVWFESLRPSTGMGLIEGATPECRSPRDLLACQRAQDHLLSEAAGRHGLALIKNCRDGRGQAYGAQENYEVTLADGRALLFWRLALWLCLLPLTLMFQMGVALVFCAAFLTLPVTALLHLVLRCGMDRARRERSFDFWIGRVWRKGWNGVEIPLGGWISKPLLWCILPIAAPLCAAVWALIQGTALGRRQRELTPFLVSRIVLAGAGRLDPAGRLQIAEKAGAVSCVAGVPEFARPIFSLGQFVKPCAVLVRIGELWSARQRVQIALGDSNLCEEAEYLRVATTLLVIDALEAGAIGDVPHLALPIQALHTLNCDPTLTARVRLRDGRMASALEIQRWYLAACRRFVDGLPDAPGEAHDVLRRWNEVLHLLGTDRDALVGRIDWVTKQFLLKRTAGLNVPDVASAGARLTNVAPCRTRRHVASGGLDALSGKAVPAAALKKLDIKYHQLSPDGYFQLLSGAGLHQRVLAHEEVIRATRLPPGGTPATTRARLIREFGGPGLTVGWKTTSNGMRIE
jgi:proteasome accessory factor A